MSGVYQSSAHNDWVSQIRYPDVLRPVQASAYKMAAAIRAASPNGSEEQLLEAAKTVLREKAGSYLLLPLTPPTPICPSLPSNRSMHPRHGDRTRAQPRRSDLARSRPQPQSHGHSPVERDRQHYCLPSRHRMDDSWAHRYGPLCTFFCIWRTAARIASTPRMPPMLTSLWCRGGHQPLFLHKSPQR